MSVDALFAHLKTGTTEVCQCWSVTRRDGVAYGFTDHDGPISFGGMTFEADSGLTAAALANSTGLSVDNTEALGLLQSDVINEADIIAGRFDGAEIVNWLVQWSEPANRQVRFAGRIGEITRAAGQFQAELRGIADALNQPQGRSFLRVCSAVLGDGKCRFNLDQAGYRVETEAETSIENRTFRVTASGYVDRWFENGILTVMSGAAQGLQGVIKHDRKSGAKRDVTLWHPIRATIAPGDALRLDPGCDKRATTCRVKFDNLINFQGFPDMPGDDWLMAVPRGSDDADGGSLFR